jgi:hypothetical protein
MAPDERIMDGREWKAVPGYEGAYEVSSMGDVVRIKSDGTRTMIGKLTSRVKKDNGYRFVNLSLGGKSKVVAAHRVVAWAFLPKPRKGQVVVNHVNRKRWDNRAENLEWCSHFQNTAHSAAIYAGRHYQEIERLAAMGLSRRDIAKRFPFSHGAVCGAANLSKAKKREIDWLYRDSPLAAARCKAMEEEEVYRMTVKRAKQCRRIASR